MLTSFSIANFKAFGPKPPQRVPLRPITLVFGANSAGKSSLIHSLLLARNAHETGEMDVRPGSAIAGDSVDLGGFYQYVHRRHESNDPVTLTFEFDTRRKTNGDDKDGAEETGLRSQLLANSETFSVTVNIDAAKSVEPRIESLTLDVDGAQLLRMVAVGSTGRKRMRINLWETEHPVSKLFFEACLAMTPRDLPTEDDKKAFRTSIYDLLEEIFLASEDTLFPCEVIGRKKSSFDAILSERAGKGPKMQVDETDDPGSAIRKNVELYFERSLTPLLKDVHDLFTASLGELIYLGPLRKLPKRHLDAEELHDLDIASGASAWLKVMSDADVRKKVNGWLGDEEKLKTAYELKVQALLTESEISRASEGAYRNRITALFNKFLVEGTYSEFENLDFYSIYGEDFASYVEAHPDLHEEIANRWLENMDDYADQEVELGNEEPMRFDPDDAKTMCLDDLYNYTQIIFQHFRDNSDDLKEFVSRAGGIEEGARKLARELVEKQSGVRRELSIIEKRNGTALSHRDIGIGVSQVLPVLVHAYASQGDLIAVEQPEIHLHPALQSEIADVFIESALGEQKNTFLLETHSEHVILRILRRIRETSAGKSSTPITPNDVCVIYVDSDPETKQVVAREMKIDNRGRFVDQWPEGFFEERLKELF